jgi:Beta-lactamase superfamily domain
VEKPASQRFRFVNRDGSGPQPLNAVLKWAVVDKVLGRRRSDDVPAATPCVEADVALLARPPGVGEPARLTWLGHASWLVQLDGISLLIDPVFSKSIGPGVHRQVPLALEVAQLPHIDAQVVTHNHRDHLDLPSLRAVARPIIGGVGLAPFFARYGVGCTELEWWGESRVGAVTVHFVPAQHWSRRGLSDTNETLWGGFVIAGSTARIYSICRLRNARVAPRPVGELMIACGVAQTWNPDSGLEDGSHNAQQAPVRRKGTPSSEERGGSDSFCLSASCGATLVVDRTMIIRSRA